MVGWLTTRVGTTAPGPGARGHMLSDSKSKDLGGTVHTLVNVTGPGAADVHVMVSNYGASV
jgi:hypothetical protein